MTATLTAGILGGPISGALLSLHGVAGLAGWQWLFLLEGLPAIVLGVVVLRVLTDGPEDAAWLPRREKEALVACLRAEQLEARGAHTVAAAMKHPTLWLLSAVYFTVPLALYAFSFFVPQIIRGAFAGSTFQIGLISAVPYLVGAIAMVIVGRHSDRTDERRWHVAVAALVCGVGFVAAAYTHSVVMSMLALSVAMLGLASMFGPFWTLATSFVNGAGAAAGIALINSVGNVGGFVGPYVLGYIKDVTQSFSTGLILIGAAVVLGGALVLAVRDPQKIHHRGH
jgi:ACS family tartrate transporter-like MFS transporter